METNNDGKLVRHPIWQSLYDEMKQAGIAFGNFYSFQYLEEKLRCPANTIAFAAQITALNDKLIPEGYYLSRRGQRDRGYAIVADTQVERSSDMMRRAERKKHTRAELLTNGVLTNPKANLPEDQRKRMEHKLKVMETERILTKKPLTIAQLLAKSGTKAARQILGTKQLPGPTPTEDSASQDSTGVA